MFSRFQAGFRKGRGVEDQIIRVNQRIADGFQREEKSVLVMLDFSKAYDTLWRQRLLKTMLNRGVPRDYILWLNSFLLNRQAKARFNGVYSKSRQMKQGLPQGSVLAPIMFLFYIDELAKLLPEDLTVSMYADDVSILSSAASTGTAESRAQSAVDIVDGWSKQWKLQLNASKSEASCFSLAMKDAVWQPSITINNQRIRFEPFPRLLGVILDRRLTFAKQVDNVIAKANRKMKLLSAVSHSEWGWRKSDLRKVYLAHVQSVLNFASSGWQPWLSNTRIKQLEVVQNKCLRLITTQAKSSPIDSLRAESGVPSIASTIRANCLRSKEKALRLPPNHPRRIALTDNVKRRILKTDFRRKSEDLEDLDPQLFLQERLPLNFFETRPWERGLRREVVFPYLKGIEGRGDAHSTIQEAALHRAREINAQFNIYTDGSASAGTTDGGAGVVITRGDPANPTIVTRLQERGATYTCSFEEEKRAMQMAMEWMAAHLDATNSAAIFTDSQSLCMALVSTSPGLDDLRLQLNNIRSQVTLQWIPGHCNIVGNDMADEAAKQATSLPGRSRDVSYGSACARIRHITKDIITHSRTKEVYSSFSKDREKNIKNRSDQSLLAKLRSGHYIGLRAYKSRIDPTTSPKCNLCDTEEDQDLEHWLQRCPATARERHYRFGEDSGGLNVLTKHPMEVIALSRQLGAHLSPSQR
jgi:ribonuclease HI